MRIFITGGTGLVGSRLITRLLQREDQPVLLTRRAAAAREKFGSTVQIVEGDPMQPGAGKKTLKVVTPSSTSSARISSTSAWNDKFKTLMVDSRIKSTTHVVDALRNNPRRADGSTKVLVNASAIGWYGPHGDEELTEQDPPGNDFLARLSVDWERTALAVKSADVRVALIRIGIVLDLRGGALAQMLTPFKLGMGGPVASGKQWMSWIHHEDLVGIFLLALDKPLAVGPLNGTVQPGHQSRFFHDPGEGPASAVVYALTGVCLASAFWRGGRGGGPCADVSYLVQPNRLGYSFQFPVLEAALLDASSELR